MSKNSDWIRLLVKFKGRCKECGKEISTGEYALWSRTSRAIRHLNCGTADLSSDRTEDASSLIELNCYICGSPAGCLKCVFEAVCDREQVSQACICDRCSSKTSPYENYQKIFLETLKTRVKT